MCAINGSTGNVPKIVEKMNTVTGHRGPDGTGVWSGAVTLGHNRLAIIDLSENAAQPMASADERYVLSFNGEIYNYRELRKELEGRYAFRTDSDTEVVLAGYAVWGRNVFTRLNGMYALALFDTKTEELLLLRDPVGIKPLYLGKHAGEYVFSSELKALLAAGIAPKLNRKAFDWYMRTLYVPGPQTMIEGVEKLIPGMLYRIKNGSYATEKIEYKPQSKKVSVSGVHDAVVAAVERQLLSDRPLGIYLSGGVDSSAVLASAVALGKKMDTFSVGFGGVAEGEKFNADAVLAGRIAKHFGATHHPHTILPFEVPDLLQEAAYHLDEPVANATIVAQLALARAARKDVVVALTGDGGDEVFGGYERYRISRIMDLYQMVVPGYIRDQFSSGFLGKLNTESIEDRYALFHFQKDHQLRDVLRTAAQVPDIEEGGSVMDLDRRLWLVDEALARSDRLAMAAGLETRPPLLDLELMHQVSDIPLTKHVSPFGTKQVLKYAFRKELPGWVLNQPKRGWFSPGAKWLRDEKVEAFAREVLTAGYAPGTDALFDWQGIGHVFEEHQQGGYHAQVLIALVVFQLWSRRFGVSV